MRFCDRHYDMLKEEIKSRNLWGMVSKDGKECMERMLRYQTSRDLIDFDPLLAAHNLIVLQILDALGPELLVTEKGCPVCYINQVHKETCKNPKTCTANFDEWIIEGAKDARDIVDGLMEKEVPRA